MNTQQFDNNTPLSELTVGQLREILGQNASTLEQEHAMAIPNKRTVYGIHGIAKLFGCSRTTANRIKQSGRIDRAVTQIGRQIIVDADLALELAGKKTGGRRS